ncbi:uncharacterized protein [Typha angustifolia]|uniref:uncharacterized protein n=1 Tax=Typha angustifolia TaxID=59011 RepID=UPI003C2F3F0C
MTPPKEPHSPDNGEDVSRCLSLLSRLDSSPKLPQTPKSTLLRLVKAELRFLSRPIRPLASNLGYLDAVCHVIHHPAVRSVSRVCRPVGPASGVHVDVVCAFRRVPAWVLVSDRNPSYVTWVGSPGGKRKGLRDRVERVVTSARSAGALRPERVVFVFARGMGDGVSKDLVGQFGAVEIGLLDELEVFEEMEEGWVGIKTMESEEFRWALDCRVFEIKIGEDSGAKGPTLGTLEGKEEMGLCDAFGSLLSKMRPSGLDAVELINFDTTALIAMVSGISNGGAEHLLKAPEDEMRARFKSNYEFVVAQAMSELQYPILAELENVIAGKKGIVCQSVYLEFQELVVMCGGPNEKMRASQLVKWLLVVPDTPSTRLMDLPTTRKLALKNKIVFGTGDHWHAPTLTANMGFVRAISQTGMSLLTIEHRPHALTGV